MEQLGNPRLSMRRHWERHGVQRHSAWCCNGLGGRVWRRLLMTVRNARRVVGPDGLQPNQDARRTVGGQLQSAGAARDGPWNGSLRDRISTSAREPKKGCTRGQDFSQPPDWGMEAAWRGTRAKMHATAHEAVRSSLACASEGPRRMEYELGYGVSNARLGRELIGHVVDVENS